MMQSLQNPKLIFYFAIQSTFNIKYYDMTHTKNFYRNLTPKSVLIRMLTGAIIGLAAISLLIFPIKNPDPAWGEYWRIRPLIITPLVAAFGFLSFFLKDYLKPQSDAGKIVVFLISLLAFMVALWMGTILGLDGTLWD